MDAFLTHSSIISDYRSYLKSFLAIADGRILGEVSQSFEGSGFIPEPLIQFNPAYVEGKSLSDLATESNNKINSQLPWALGDYRLFHHQIEALRMGLEDIGFIVTSGTGSGKSLTYLSTIFNHIFTAGSGKTKGVKAILVYPMNALINSQEEEIKKYSENYKKASGAEFPISFAKYTGQEKVEERQKVEQEEPDIILTNYMMLELIMTRASESWLRTSLKKSLKYLVFDELHTYKGRQGADVSMLIRRIHNHCDQPIICIGTSATMASQGTPEEKRQAVAKVATKIFGVAYTRDQIIDEKLRTCTEGNLPNAMTLHNAVMNGIDKDADETAFIQHPLSNWLELKIALSNNQGKLERGKPISVPEIAGELKKAAEIDISKAHIIITDLLQWAEKLNERNRHQRKSYLPFRFHQFIAQTSTVAVTLESRAQRTITIQSGRYVKDEEGEKLLFPLLFSRYSGIDFICVEKETKSQTLLPRNPEAPVTVLTQKELTGDQLNEHNLRFGYLILDEGEEFWNDDLLDLAPEAWLNNANNAFRPYYEWHMPRQIYFNSAGQYSHQPIYPLKGYYLPVKLRVDPTAGIFTKIRKPTKIPS